MVVVFHVITRKMLNFAILLVYLGSPWTKRLLWFPHSLNWPGSFTWSTNILIQPSPSTNSCYHLTFRAYRRSTFKPSEQTKSSKFSQLSNFFHLKWCTSSLLWLLLPPSSLGLWPRSAHAKVIKLLSVLAMAMVVFFPSEILPRAFLAITVLAAMSTAALRKTSNRCVSVESFDDLWLLTSF